MYQVGDWDNSSLMFISDSERWGIGGKEHGGSEAGRLKLPDAGAGAWSAGHPFSSNNFERTGFSFICGRGNKTRSHILSYLIPFFAP